MITHAGPNRYLVLALYAALVVVALLVLGSRLVPTGQAHGPTGSPGSSADAEVR